MGLDLVAQRGAVDDLFDEDHGAAGIDEGRATRRFVAFAVVLVPLARAAVVPPLCVLANCFRGRKRSLTLREGVFLVFAGLRGAIAFALARNATSEHRRTIVAATTAVILFTTFVLGSLTRPVLQWLRMIHVAGEPALAHRPDDGGALGRKWERWDREIFQPLFGAPVPNESQGGGHAKEARRVLEDDGHIELQPLSTPRGDGDGVEIFGAECE
jgi:hypothetical protein